MYNQWGELDLLGLSNSGLSSNFISMSNTPSVWFSRGRRKNCCLKAEVRQVQIGIFSTYFTAGSEQPEEEHSAKWCFLCPTS